MVVTVLKTIFLKSKPRVITSRDCRLFDNDKFKVDLKNSLRVRSVSFYMVFEEIFPHVLQRHALIKQKVSRVNHAPYVKKTKQNKKQLYGPFLWMGFNCLRARATSRRQFTFYH